MKKILITILLLLLAVPLFAAGNPVEVQSAGYNMTTFAIPCSSNTATQIIAANNKRVSITINNPSLVYSVYIASYAATAAVSTSSLEIIRPTSTYHRDTNPYLGAFYGLSFAGNQSTTTVNGEEISR